MKTAIENLQTRVSEIELVMLPSIGFDIKNTQQNLFKVLHFKKEFEIICLRLDCIESLVNHAKHNLDVFEKQVDTAEENLVKHKADHVSLSLFHKPKTVPKFKAPLNYEPPIIFEPSYYLRETKQKN